MTSPRSSSTEVAATRGANRLAGKVAFIAGATVGIGKVTAIEFAREGAAVVVTGRREAEGQGVVDQIAAEGGRALFVKTDITEIDQVERAIRETTRAFGRLDILFNNAGGSSNADGKVTNASLDEFWRVIKLDLYGTFLCSRFAIPEMVKAGGGAVINNASMVGIKGELNRAGYTCAKGGVIALTRATAADFVKEKIRVNAIAPGAVATERILAMVEASPLAKAAVSAQPLGLIEPMAIARLAVYLASDDGASITGEVFPISGGR